MAGDINENYMIDNIHCEDMSSGDIGETYIHNDMSSEDINDGNIGDSLHMHEKMLVSFDDEVDCDLGQSYLHDNISSGDITRDNSSVDDNVNESHELYELSAFHKANVKNLKLGHLNINSLRYKFQPIVCALNKGLLDILSIQETKLDTSFPMAQFVIDGYKCYRKDVNCNKGGLIIYVRSDIPQKRLNDLEVDINNENGRVETMAVEVILNSEKWVLYSMYKQPKVKNAKFVNIVEDVMIKCTQHAHNVMIVGDLNVNFKNEKHCLTELCDLYGMTNIVREPTCRKGDSATIIDVVLTNVTRRLQNVTHVDSGLSDFHDLICYSTKMHVCKRVKQVVKYRSYKNFDSQNYKHGLSIVPFHVADIFDSVDDAYWFCEHLLLDVINQHAPIKTRTTKQKSVRYMNGELRKAINVRDAFKRRYYKCKNQANWERYRYQRNLVVKLRRKSLNRYTKEKCTGQAGTKSFWKTVKPLISDKTISNDCDVILFENENVVNDAASVCNIFNQHFVTMTKDIGDDDTVQSDDTVDSIIQMYSNHDSIKHIKNTINAVELFKFKHVSVECIQTKLLKLNIGKATGSDNIPAKLLKLGASVLCHPLQYIINKSITECVFPDAMKYGEIRPIYKKNDSLYKGNYRPVNVLSIASKVLESVLVDQMTEYFEPIFSPCLSGFRKHHSCQSVLMKFVEECKANLDINKVGGAVLTDLSSAFDCLPHRLLTAKLHAYGVNKEACSLVLNYFYDRKQRVKIGSTNSDWLINPKGAPQGSLFGPFAFNIFTNDLLDMVIQECNVFNYADDNTILYFDNDLESVKIKLEYVIAQMLRWFSDNFLQANPNKFQLITFSKNVNIDQMEVKVGNAIILSEPTVKLLGVQIDNTLNFNLHITQLCRKAGFKLNALARLSKSLDFQGKMMLFNAFILSHFMYSPVVWHLCSSNDMKKVEKIQKRALRYVTDDFTSPYNVLLEKCLLPSMFIQRMRFVMIEVYKVLNNIGPVYLQGMFKSKPTNYDMRNGCILTLPTFKSVKYGSNSLKYQGAKTWNSLPNSMKEAHTLKHFKLLLNTWNGSA